MGLCRDVYITQDGYDSGQILICHKHETYEPVMSLKRPGFQEYDVTLDRMIQLVAKHSEEHPSE